MGTSPAYADLKEDRLAKKIGITRQELIRRKQLADQTCGDPNAIVAKGQKLDGHAKCHVDTVWGRQ